jgi:hypothetical protein
MAPLPHRPPPRVIPLPLLAADEPNLAGTAATPPWSSTSSVSHSGLAAQLSLGRQGWPIETVALVIIFLIYLIEIKVSSNLLKFS